MKTLEECKAMRSELLAKFKQATPGHFAEITAIKVSQAPIVFNPRMRTSLGRVFFKKWKMELNVRLLKENPSEFDATFAHELAHLVAFSAYRDGKHGRSWKHVMRIFGFPPERCHALDTNHLRRKHATLAYAYCACRQNIEIKARRLANMKRGCHYRCLACKTRLILMEGS